MRARLAIAVSRQTCELREVSLRDKPAALLEASPKATVPVLVDLDGTVIEQSLDIMQWALRRNDPERWLSPDQGDTHEVLGLIKQCDEDFKSHLDRYKYPDRHQADRVVHRAAGATFLYELNAKLAAGEYLFGNCPSIADMAIAPFVRQFAYTDEAWFAGESWSRLKEWLQQFVQSALFERVMMKIAPWQPGSAGIRFPD
jgi:glutathione S-transferase